VTARRRRRAGAIAAAAALVLAVAVASGSSAATASPSASAAANAENGFALALLPRLAGKGNVVFSPYSIDAALTMAAAGARGATAAQLDRVLGASDTSAAVADAGALRRAMTAAVGSGQGAPTLDVANALWTQTGLSLGAPFVATLTDDFGAPPQATDFSAAPQAALAAINGWVSRHTAGIIPAVLSPGSITPATRFVLANAIYLKALWATQFDAAATRPGPFTTATGARVTVPFMSARAVTYPYATGHGWIAVDLPYRSSSLSLLAVLPVAQTLTSLERSLTAPLLAELARALTPRSVDLLIPRFTLRTQTSLNAALEALGVRAAFLPSADFRGITTAVPLAIALVEHAAYLKLDEQGTVAAGATVIVGPTAVARPVSPAITIDLDHPFLVLLRDDRSGAVLFAGAVANPGGS
jgi:serpin B